MNTNLYSIIYHKKTQRFAIVALLLFISCTAHSQSFYGVVNNASAITTITRAWQDVPQRWVDYSFDGVDGTFYMREEGTTFILTATLRGIQVTDFEILNDTLFFCGNKKNKAVVGSIGINGLFSGTDVFNIYESYFFEQAKKIAVYKNNNIFEVAVIGNSSEGHGISHFHWIIWNLTEYNYIETTGMEVFEDVDVTDNYVVAVENKGGVPNGAHYMRLFEKTASPSFLYSPIGDDIYCIHTSNYSSNHVTHISGDTFAVVALSLQPNNYYGNLILLYNGTTYLGSIYTQLWNYYKPQWCIRDFRYNPSDHKLYLLEDMTMTAQGGIEPMIFQYDYINPSAPVPAFFTIDNSFLKSIDCNHSSLILGSGTNTYNGLFTFRWRLNNHANCLHSTTFTNNNPQWTTTLFNHPVSRRISYPANDPYAQSWNYTNFYIKCN